MSLAVLPPIPANHTSDGKIILTKRFIEGMKMKLRFWDVPMSVVLEPGPPMQGQFDAIACDPASLPFKVESIFYDDPRIKEVLSRHEVVLATVSHRQNQISRQCRSVGTACVYVAEFGIKTRLQIARASTNEPLRLARRLFWVANQERLHRKSIRIADGIQSNGTPCYDSYAPINKNPLLFFDNRAGEEMLITAEELEAREASLDQGKPLRLLFSGQFTKVKGADQLIDVAVELRRLGVPFEFTLCGGGPEEPQIRADIDKHQLGDCVKLTGVLDSRTELHPLIKKDVDLFVCCHIQGDPSQTYLDVMTCGVPIVGYNNEAFVGLVRHSQSNRLTPMSQPRLMAEAIAELNAHRNLLKEFSRKNLDFSRQHTFDRNYQRRIDHIRECRSQFEASTPRQRHSTRVSL